MAFPFRREGRPSSYRNDRPALPFFLNPIATILRRMRRGADRADSSIARRIRPAARSRKVRFEPLEPRLLLSADLSFTAVTASDLTLRTQDVDGVEHLQIVLADETAPGGEIVVASQELALTSSVTLTGSLEADRFTVNFAGLPDSSVLSISIVDPTSEEAPGTADVLRVTGLDSEWEVSGVDAGAVNGIAFTGIEHLEGGAGADRFAYGAAGSLTGGLAGGDGADVVDYSAAIEGVTVDLATLTGIETVIGGAGSDTLVGVAGGSTWNITGAGSGDVAGIAFSGI